MEKWYFYKAKDRQGADVSGTVTGSNRREAARVLQAQNLIVLEIREKKKWDELLIQLSQLN